MSDITRGVPRENSYATRRTVPWTRWAAGIALVMLIMFTSHSFQFLFAENLVTGWAEGPSARSNPIYAALFLIQFLLFLVLVFFHLLQNGVQLPFVVAVGFCLYVSGSIFWSISPDTTLAPAFLFSYLVIAAYTASACFPPRQFAQLYFYACTFILACSFILLVVNPELAGRPRFDGGWFLAIEFSGIMSSKNFAGMIFASTAIMAINGRYLAIPALLRYVVLIFAIAAVVLSNSATSVMILILLGGLSLVLSPSIQGWKSIHYLVLVTLALIIPVLPFVSAGEVLALLGRDPTFTGRVDLWDFGYSALSNHPILGHGYYAFFATDAFSPVWQLWENFRYFHATSFHNSSVEILVSLGLLGGFVLLVTTIKACGIVSNQSIDPGTRLCLGMLLGAFLIGSMMEFAMFHHNFIATFILFYMLFASMWRYDDQAA